MHTPAPDSPEGEPPSSLPESCFAGGELSPGAVTPAEYSPPPQAPRKRYGHHDTTPELMDTRLRVRITPTRRGEEEGTATRIHELREHRERHVTPTMSKRQLLTNIIPPTPSDLQSDPAHGINHEMHSSRSNPSESRRPSPAEDLPATRLHSAPPDVAPFSSNRASQPLPPKLSIHPGPHTLPDVPSSLLAKQYASITLTNDDSDPFMNDETYDTSAFDTDVYEEVGGFDNNPVLDTATTSIVLKSSKKGGKPTKVVSDDFEAMERTADKIFGDHAALARQSIEDVIGKYISRKKGSREISQWNVYQKFWKVNQDKEMERGVRGLREGETVDSVSVDTLRARAWKQFQVENKDWEARLNLFQDFETIAGTKEQTFRQRSTTFKQVTAKQSKFVRPSHIQHQHCLLICIQATAIYNQYGLNMVWIIVGEDRLRDSGESPGATGVCHCAVHCLDVANESIA